jgi:MinD-like ATPase involved in chromosome partitioning or flagellar assembly
MLAEEHNVIVAVHSYKGGTGKTLLSANLATTFAAKGKKTCLLDMDFRAPSLYSLFKMKEPEYWLNDYLNGGCCAKDLLQKCDSDKLGIGNLFVGFANPSIEAFREIASKDKRWEMEALTRLFSFRDSLFNELGFDWLFLDTSPGLQYSSVNAVVVADVALVVTTLDESDVQGTQLMLQGLYEHFEKKTLVVMNKVPDGLTQSQRVKDFQEVLGGFPLVFGECIGCSCDLPISEDPCFFACHRRDHQFSKTLEKIASEIVAHQRWARLPIDLLRTSH